MTVECCVQPEPGVLEPEQLWWHFDLLLFWCSSSLTAVHWWEGQQLRSKLPAATSAQVMFLVFAADHSTTQNAFQKQRLPLWLPLCPLSCTGQSRPSVNTVRIREICSKRSLRTLAKWTYLRQGIPCPQLLLHSVLKFYSELPFRVCLPFRVFAFKSKLTHAYFRFFDIYQLLVVVCVDLL